jgi:anti-sigma B factor antagonist
MAEAALHCYPRPEGSGSVLVLEGCLDLINSPKGLETMEAYIREHGPDVVFDTARLDFIDSKGVGALLAAAKAAKDAGGQLRIQEPTFVVRKILETCGLLQLFMPSVSSLPKEAKSN